MYQIQAVITDENLAPIVPAIEDSLRIDVSLNIETIGKMTLQLPIRYEQQLTALGVLTGLNQQPVTVARYWMYALVQIKGANCQPFVWGRQAFIITRARRLLSDDGNRIIEITGEDATSILRMRGVPFTEDLPQAQRAGPVTTVLQAIINDAFGPGIDARRDWILAGNIANNIVPGIGPNWDPKLNYNKSVHSLFREAIDFSRQQNAPIFFRVRPTINAGPLGEGVALPMVVETFQNQVGQDRSQGNAAGNQVITLSDVNGMLSGFEWGVDYTDDYTVSFVGGQGTGAARIVAPAPAINNVRANSSRWGWVEDVSSVTDLTQLQEVIDRQDAVVQDGISRSSVTVTSTIGRMFVMGRVGPQGCGDFELGDKITMSIVPFKGAAVGQAESYNGIVRASLLSIFEGRLSLALTVEPERLT